MVFYYLLSRSTSRQPTKHPPHKNRNKRRMCSRAARATCDLTNCSTSAAAIDITCCQDLHIPPRMITFNPPGPSHLFTSKGKKKKRSEDLHKQFTPKPPAQKIRKVHRSDPDAIARQTRSQTEPVSRRTRSRTQNAPTISTRTAKEPKRAASRPIEQEILMEFDVLLDVTIEKREVAKSRSQKRTELGGVDETVRSDKYDDLKRHISKVKMYAQQIGSKRLQAEADQERLRQKKEEEKDNGIRYLRRGHTKNYRRRRRRVANKI